MCLCSVHLCGPFFCPLSPVPLVPLRLLWRALGELKDGVAALHPACRFPTHALTFSRFPRQTLPESWPYAPINPWVTEHWLQSLRVDTVLVGDSQVSFHIQLRRTQGCGNTARMKPTSGCACCVPSIIQIPSASSQDWDTVGTAEEAESATTGSTLLKSPSVPISSQNLPPPHSRKMQPLQQKAWEQAG